VSSPLQNSWKKLPKILPAAVCAQWVRCGKPRCRCNRGKPHGPYYYFFWRDGSKLRKAYIPKAEVDQVREVCEARRKARERERAAMSEWRALVADIRLAEREAWRH
jgi:Family of unknown function (DUF6788)